MSDIDVLFRLVRSVLARTVETERRIGAIEFRGRVAEVDGQQHAIKLVIGQTPEGEDVLSPWVPVAQTAGALKVHDLPSVGQQGSLLSAHGDIEQGRFAPLHWSEGNEAVSTDPDVKIIKFGAVQITVTDGGILAEVGDSSLELTASGISLNGQSIAMAGASLKHNGKNVGDTHVHSGVENGGGSTAGPH